jgi:hypothetical protein
MISFGEENRQSGGARRLAEADCVLDPRFQNPGLSRLRGGNIPVQDIEEQHGGLFRIEVVDVHSTIS